MFKFSFSYVKINKNILAYQDNKIRLDSNKEK